MKENLGTNPKDDLGKISALEQINKQVKELISQGELNQAASYLEGKIELQPDLAKLLIESTTQALTQTLLMNYATA